MSAIVEYPVMEYFQTIQGEGVYSGTSAFFIRLGGCDVGCVWCDVKESWDPDAHPKLSVNKIAELANESESEIVVITGGEPAMYDLTELCKELKKKGKRIHIETSGAYPVLGEFDWICLSPKKFKSPLKEELLKADELKVIAFNMSDFEWAESFEKDVKVECVMLLQPEWSKRDKMTTEVINYIDRHPKWRLSLQTHKYIGIP
jgi:7-carboxy-7-deazaguanine synthase